MVKTLSHDHGNRLGNRHEGEGRRNRHVHPSHHGHEAQRRRDHDRATCREGWYAWEQP